MKKSMVWFGIAGIGFGLALLNRKKIKGFAFGLTDYYFRKRFSSMFKKESYFNGWGKRDQIKAVKMHMKKIDTSPEKITITWIKEHDVENKDGSKRRIGKFTTNVSQNLLNEKEYWCHFGFIEPSKERNNKKLIIHLPAGGDVGLGWRGKTFGNDFANKGYSYCSFIPPIYKFRRDEEQNLHGISAKSFFHASAIVGSYLTELRALINHFAESTKFQSICLTGISYGAIMITHLLNYPILTPENAKKGIKISCVPVMPKYNPKSMFLEQSLKCLNYQNNPIPQEIEEYFPDLKGKSLKEIKNIPLFLYKTTENHFLFPKNYEELKRIPKYYFNKIVLIQASHDHVLEKWERKRVKDYYNAFCKDNQVTIEKRMYYGGHFILFRDQNAIKMIKKAVIDSFES